MLVAPRGAFVPEQYAAMAYADAPLRVFSHGFNISAPHIHAQCLEALDIQPGDRVLDIGSGSGVLTALCGVLATPGGSVLGLEVDPRVLALGEAQVGMWRRSSGFEPPMSIEFELRNCFLADPEGRTFQKIACGASCQRQRLPLLLELLERGGKMVVPCEDDYLLIEKDEHGVIEEHVLANVRFGDLVEPTRAEIQVHAVDVMRAAANRVAVPHSTYQSDADEFGVDKAHVAQLVHGDFAVLDHCDVLFSCDGGEMMLGAHRGVIGSRSEYFKAMFHSGMSDANKRQIDVPCTYIMVNDYEMLMFGLADMPGEAFKELLRYAYTDAPRLTEELVGPVMMVATYYQVPRLFSLCELFIKVRFPRILQAFSSFSDDFSNRKRSRWTMW